MSGGKTNQQANAGAKKFAWKSVALAIYVVATCVAFPVNGDNMSSMVIIEDTSSGEAEAAKQKSIVVSKSKSEAISGDSESLMALATDTPAPLEPIASDSQNEPELAEPRGLIPDLADPLDHELIARAVTPKAGLQRKQRTIEPEPVSFHGITPGMSHRRDVLLDWGDPRTEDTMSVVLNYRFDQLRAVDVAFEENIVEAILIQLEEPTPALDLIDRLGIHAIHHAEYHDNEGGMLALVYPERGVVLSVTPDSIGDGEVDVTTTLVDQIIIQSIRAGAFIQRAEQLRSTNLTQSISDLEQAIQIERNQAEARWLLSQLYLEIGRTASAERHAHDALELQPESLQFRLQLAACLRQLGAHDRATELIRTVLDSDDAAPLVRSQALYEQGHLAAIASPRSTAESIAHFTRAIELADGLAESEVLNERHTAQKLLVDAHLAVALQVAQGRWKGKDQSVSQWIARASGLAEALIAEDDAYLPLRLQVAITALSAACQMEKPIDPLLWIDEAEHSAMALRAATTDPLLVAQHDWQLGLAYAHACQVQHRRSKSASATTMGHRAAELLDPLAFDRSEQPDTQSIRGRLYFQLGAICAVHEKDHVAACQWYDEALELLLNPTPVTPLAGAQQNGDAMVSMGVSYWSVGQREQAIELTQFGVELIEHAVEQGKLEARSLAVPYGNLAAMYQAMGEKETADRYLRLSKK